MAYLKAIVFGAIGTLTETSELQRQGFNIAFADAGLDWHWDAAAYRAMVVGPQSTVGGRARIAKYAANHGTVLSDDRIAALHEAKTRNFHALVEQGGLPLNPGVAAMLAEAQQLGLRRVFASTTARASIDAILLATQPSLAGSFDLIMSGEAVAQPKPAPDVYLALLAQLHLDASEAIAIEDSEPSLTAALAAGLATFAVPGTLWHGAAFTGASGVFDTLEGIRIEALAHQLGRDIFKSAHAVSD